MSETGAGPGTRLCGKKGALTLLETAVDLLVLQQLLAVVLKRLISRVRHDEKPPLIGDAGNGHGRPGGGRGGARQESLPGGAGFAEDTAPSGLPRLCTPLLQRLRLYALGCRRAPKETSRYTIPCRSAWVEQGRCPLRGLGIFKSLLFWNHKRLCNKPR